MRIRNNKVNVFLSDDEKFILKRDCQISNLILYIILILVCLFGILRNIPYFSYLAPTVVSTI